ncbi:g386 [Coccomyxa viridis]|uniref:16S rRNA (cytosine(967)-C(5))-methyltransferase n=1 Tax=Coccomyxa viridis TaxID=1274662 RepID=A0ABP1FFL1_9CHLO
MTSAADLAASLKQKSGKPRTAAIQQLIRIEEDGAYVGLVGGSPRPRKAETEKISALPVELDSRDARFVTELVSGVTRWKGRLDWVIRQLRPQGGIDFVLLQILRLGVYELVELGLPDHVINDHVDMARKLVRPEAAKVANAILRRVTRMRRDGNLPKPEVPPGAKAAEKTAMLAVAASHPAWMVERWLQRYGEADTIKLLVANNRRPTYSLRVNKLRVSMGELQQRLQDSEVECEPSPFLPDDFLRISKNLREVLAQGSLSEGLCQVQDESAGMVVALLDPQPGERVLDACAAPGGKALFAAARMLGQGHLVALDASESRLRGLAATAKQQGMPPGFLTVQAALLQSFAAEHTAAGRQLFDRVLLDVPCSGLGVLSKRADLRWRRRPADVAAAAALQDKLLRSAALLVRPGGLLVYSTCSIEPEENEERVASFLAADSDFTAEAAPSGVLSGGVVTEAGHVATLPHVHGIDGAFGARLRRAASRTYEFRMSM